MTQADTNIFNQESDSKLLHKRRLRRFTPLGCLGLLALLAVQAIYEDWVVTLVNEFVRQSPPSASPVEDPEKDPILNDLDEITNQSEKRLEVYND